MIHVFFYVLISSVKWDHLENFELKSINTFFLDQNPIGSSSTLWARPSNNN